MVNLFKLDKKKRTKLLITSLLVYNAVNCRKSEFKNICFISHVCIDDLTGQQPFAESTETVTIESPIGRIRRLI